MPTMRRPLAGLTLVLLFACGGSGGATGKASWMEDHGPALDALDTELQAARTTLSSLQRPNILGSCTALRDALADPRKGLPVPDPKSNTASRSALDLIALGTEDCFEGHAARTSLSSRSRSRSCGRARRCWTWLAAPSKAGHSYAPGQG